MFTPSSTFLLAFASLVLSIGSSYGRQLGSGAPVSVTLLVHFDDHPEETGLMLVDTTHGFILDLIHAGTYTKPRETIAVHYKIEDHLDYQIVMQDSAENGMSGGGWITICPGKLSVDDEINPEFCLLPDDPLLGKMSYLPFNAEKLGFGGPVPPFPDCTDNDEAEFFVNERRGVQNCAWLRETPKFQEHLCHYSHEAAMACQETCISCDRDFGAHSNSECVNDNDVFYINDNIGFQNCEWLATSPVHKRRHCQADRSAHYVCRELCNTCA